MRFKTFLEAEVSPYKSEDQGIYQLAQNIKKHCSNAMHNPVKIYRGTKSTLKSGLYHPETGERKSQNTKNYYTKLLDSNPLNKDFPLRSKSFIGSTDDEKAGRYGRVDLSKPGTMLTLFPYDSTKIGVVNKPDFWDTIISFDAPLDHRTKIAGMNTFWEELLQDEFHKEEDFTPTLEELVTFLRGESIDVIFKKLAKEYIVDSSINPVKAVTSFINQLETVYSYEHLGCFVETPRQLDAENSEVWISGPCIGVTQHDIQKVRKLLKQ